MSSDRQTDTFTLYEFFRVMVFILVIVFDDFVTTQPVVRSVAGWAAEKSRCIESFLFGWVDAISITKFLYKSVFSFKNLYHFCISVSDLKILYNTDFSVYLASLPGTTENPKERYKKKSVYW